MSFTIFYIKKTPFQAIKTRSLKNRKILFFQSVIFPTFFGGAIQARKMSFRIFQNVQKRPLFQLFFQAIKNRKMSFTIFQNEKTPFQAIKTRSSKTRKIDIFPKGLTHGFGPKMDIFPPFFLQAIQGRKMTFTIFQNEKSPLQAIKTKSLKSRKNFPNCLVHGFGQKLAIFPWCFLGNIGQENVFYDILERKNAFLGYKNKKFKKLKI